MFFKNIENYSKGKLNTIYVISLLAYFSCILLAPTIVVASRYTVFAQSTGSKLTFIGICLLISIVIIATKWIRQKLEKFPTNTHGQRCIRFTVELFFDLIIPVAVVILLVLMNVNFQKAFDTIRDCIIWFIAGILVNNLVLKYVEAEKSIRNEAQHDVEKQKRMSLFK